MWVQGNYWRSTALHPTKSIELWPTRHTFSKPSAYNFKALGITPGQGLCGMHPGWLPIQIALHSVQLKNAAKVCTPVSLNRALVRLDITPVSLDITQVSLNNAPATLFTVRFQRWKGATTECRATSDHLLYMCQNLLKNEAKHNRVLCDPVKDVNKWPCIL